MRLFAALLLPAAVSAAVFSRLIFALFAPACLLTQSLDVSEKDAALAAAFEPDIGTRAFWYRLSDNERQRDSLAQSGRANPWISFSEARGFYKEKGGVEKNSGIAERHSKLSAEKKEALDR